MAQCEMAILDQSGDTKVIWDSGNKDEVDTARETFEKLKKKAYLAYSVKGKDGEKGEVLHKFDSEAERMIMAPQPKGADMAMSWGIDTTSTVSTWADWNSSYVTTTGNGSTDDVAITIKYTWQSWVNQPSSTLTTTDNYTTGTDFYLGKMVCY